MRCSACNKKLSDYETTLKHAVTGEYLDTCLDCLSEIAKDVPMPVKARKDLIHSMDISGSDDIEGLSADSELSESEILKYYRVSYDDNNT